MFAYFSLLQAIVKQTRCNAVAAALAVPRTERERVRLPWPYGDEPTADEHRALERWLFDRDSGSIARADRRATRVVADRV